MLAALDASGTAATKTLAARDPASNGSSRAASVQESEGCRKPNVFITYRLSRAICRFFVRVRAQLGTGDAGSK